jgi:CheY-like chemotaxis protein
MLEDAGCDVEVAADGREAVERWARGDIDLVFMDCQMPTVDGFQATREIRERESGRRRVPIVALTANSMVGDRERCLAAGMDDYLAKPFVSADLVAVLGRWVHPEPSHGVSI